MKKSKRLTMRYTVFLLAVLFVMSPAAGDAGFEYSSITMFAVARYEGSWSFKAEQDNPSRLTVDDDPGAGEQLEWIEIYDDDPDFPGFPNPLEEFGGGQTFGFSYPAENNDKRQIADIDIQGIPAARYQSDSTGTFWVKLRRVSDSNLYGPYQVTVYLRTIATIDFTVFDGQTRAGTADISAAPWSPGATKYEWSVIPKHDLTIGPYAGSTLWQADVKEAPPTYPPTNPAEEDDRFIVPVGAGAPWNGHDKQIATWDGAAWQYETPAEGWAVWAVEDSQFYYMNGDPALTGVWVATAGTAIDFDYADAAQQLGRIKVSGFGGDWANSEGGFTLIITEVDGSGNQTSAASNFHLGAGTGASTPNLRLRQLLGEGYTIFDGQSWSNSAVRPFSGENELDFSWDDSGLPGGATVTLDSSTGAVTGYSAPPSAWGSDGPLELEINDGVSIYRHRPASYFSNEAARQVSFRKLTPNPLIVPNDGNPSSTDVVVAADAGPWDWSGYSDGLANSVLSGPDTASSATLTISWGAGDLYEPGESGTGSLVIQSSDGSAPSSTVDIPTVVLEYENPIFSDGFETGNTSAWSTTVGGAKGLGTA